MNNLKNKKHLLNALVLAMFTFVFYACDVAVETCDDVQDLCVEEVQVCEYDNTEYYTLNGQKFYCEGVDDCDDAEEKLTLTCTVASAKNEIEIKQLLSDIRNQLRENN